LHPDPGYLSRVETPLRYQCYSYPYQSLRNVGWHYSKSCMNKNPFYIFVTYHSLYRSNNSLYGLNFHII